jgi:hypothetical protein
LILFCSDEIEFKAGVADNVTKDTVELITEAVKAAHDEMASEPTMCITTPTGYPGFITGEDFIRGVQEAFDDSFPIFGGVAGDLFRFEKTYQFCNNAVYTDGVPFLLIAGPLLYSVGVESGWVPIGEKDTITQSDYNVVYKIGTQSAMAFFRHYLGEGNWYPVSEYPLAVYDENQRSYCLRSSIGSDEEKGSITYTGPIPEGTTIQITQTTRDEIVKAAERSVDAAVKGYTGSNPVVALCFSCTCRKQLLGTRVNEEYKILKQSNPGLPIAGFYTYGEIGPQDRDTPTKLHNDTMYTLLLGID